MCSRLFLPGDHEVASLTAPQVRRLQTDGFVVVDGFLPAADAAGLRREALQLYAAGEAFCAHDSHAPKALQLHVGGTKLVKHVPTPRICAPVQATCHRQCAGPPLGQTTITSRVRSML